MAGQAQKKAQKAASSVASTWGRAILLINVVYLIILAYRFSSGAFKPSLRWGGGFALNSGLYFLSYQGLVDAASNPGGSASAYIDLLGLTVVVQYLSLYTRYAWFLYLIVPAYLLYKYGGPLLGLLKGASGGGDEGGEPDPDEAKRLAKKERRASRGKAPRMVH